MLLMALSGAAVLILVCWAALRESEYTPEPPAAPAADGVLATAPDELDDATVADADTREALAAAAALWTVLTQDRG
jgi:hypothetical protein